LRGSREKESGGFESITEADIAAALRAKANRMQALAIGFTALVTVAFTFL